MVKLAWQLLSLGSDQSAELLFRLPAAPTHRAVPGADEGCCYVTGLPALPVGKFTAAEAQRRGLSIALISLKHIWTYIAQRKEDLTAQTLQMAL